MFRLNLVGVAVEENLDREELVRLTEGYSGADISNVCREAALMPLRRKLLKEGGFKNIENIQNLQSKSFSLTL